MKSTFAALTVLAALLACESGSTPESALSERAKGAGDPNLASPTPRPPEFPMDHHSHSNPNQARVTHIALDLTLDFDAKEIHGSVTLDFQRLQAAAPLILDAQKLRIGEVRGSDGGSRTYALGENDPLLGQELRVNTSPQDSSVTIDYRTAPDSLALQWLSKAQTAGGQMPYVYTQGQAILTRSWIPLQDTPGVRATYEAKIRAPAGMTVVMSAAERGRQDQNFVFKMPQPIPSYLIALACGDIAFGKISERCGVFADPSILAAALAEFSDTEQMLAKCEAKFGTYGWGRYDLLVLPPAFPFGGMENPTLTFVTPTIITGDRSLVALVAHELAHSWSGNLVTNATWRDFWLNEGFTVYLEQRIMDLVFGAERAAMEIETSVRELRKEVAELPLADQRLYIDLTGRSPDDAMTAIAYDKGAAFLRRLDAVFGREVFDAFLQKYFQAHAFQSITTATFLAFLEQNLLSKHPEKAKNVDVKTWVFGTGLPATLPSAESKGFQEVAVLRQQLLENRSKPSVDPSQWITHQWLEFLAGTPANLPDATLRAWDKQFGFARHSNPEIRCAFLVIALNRGLLDFADEASDFVRRVGRRKFVLPIFKALSESPDGRSKARQLFKEIRNRMHFITRNSVAKILH
jgi:leukotriene-A4 hydrolase